MEFNKTIDLNDIQKEDKQFAFVYGNNNESNDTNDTNFSDDVNLNMEKTMESEKTIVKKIYDYDKKMELVKKINKIKKKEYLLNIFKIILLQSKDYTENNNGVFVFFHNLNDETYEQIEIYVNKIYKIHSKKSSSNIMSIYSDLSDSQNYCSDIIEIKKNYDRDMQLSNKEKLIMKKKKYNDYLDRNQDKNM